MNKKEPSMRILVAGCEGFLGSYLVSALCEKNVKVLEFLNLNSQNS